MFKADQSARLDKALLDEVEKKIEPYLEGNFLTAEQIQQLTVTEIYCLTFPLVKEEFLGAESTFAAKANCACNPLFPVLSIICVECTLERLNERLKLKQLEKLKESGQIEKIFTGLISKYEQKGSSETHQPPSLLPS